MAKNVKVELNYAAVGALLKSKEMQGILREQAQRIAGAGEVEVYVAGTRAVAEAGGDNKNNALLKAMKK